MNVNSVSDVQMTLLAKSLQSARENTAAVTSSEDTVMRAVVAQQNIALAAQAAGRVNTYA